MWLLFFCDWWTKSAIYFITSRWTFFCFSTNWKHMTKFTISVAEISDFFCKLLMKSHFLFCIQLMKLAKSFITDWWNLWFFCPLWSIGEIYWYFTRPIGEICNYFLQPNNKILYIFLKQIGFSSTTDWRNL